MPPFRSTLNKHNLSDMQVDAAALAAYLAEIAAIGQSGRGIINRAAFSYEEQQAHAATGRLFEQAGMLVHSDQAGNLIGRRAGDSDLPPIMIGSHLDTVPDGGRFDGAVGIACGLELVRMLNRAGIALRHPLEVVVFAAEEAARFGASVFGSRAMAGLLPENELEQMKDAAGISVAAAMRQLGLKPSQVGAAARKRGEVAAFIEVHVEQGPVLDRSGEKVGIVTTVANSARLLATFKGCTNHSGTTPMNERRDALLAAARTIVAVNEAARDLGEGVGVATVGTIEAWPGVMSAVPGEAALGIDIRDIDNARKARMARRITEAIARIAAEQGIQQEVLVLKDQMPVALDADLGALLKRSAERLGISQRCMPSGAGHDAMNMMSIAPSALLFVPSKGGISHSPAEETSIDRIVQAVRLLLDAVLTLDSSL